MKETVHISLASQAFTFDDDAYHSLKNYLRAIELRLPKDDHETLNDVEARMAEILRAKTPSPMLVVTLTMVQQARAQMGDPEEFGEDPAGTPRETRDSPRRLYRSNDRSIAGVCGGVADFLGVDPTLVRVITLLLILFGGLSIFVYIILWIVVPDEPLQNQKYRDRR